LKEFIVFAVDFVVRTMAKIFGLVVPKGRSTEAKLLHRKPPDPRRISTICTSWTSNFAKIAFRLAAPALWYYEAESFGHDSDREINGENDKFFQIELKQRFLRCKASLPDFVAWNARIFLVLSPLQILYFGHVQYSWPFEQLIFAVHCLFP